MFLTDRKDNPFFFHTPINKMKEVLYGIFETHCSFAININLIKKKNNNYVVFKPYITISKVDSDHISFMIRELGLSNTRASPKKKEKKEHNLSHSLNIQNFDDIDKVMNFLSDYEWISTNKKSVYEKFKEGYDLLKSIGHVHKSWNEEFIKLIDIKLSINQKRAGIDNNRYQKSEWLKRINETLGM